MSQAYQIRRRGQVYLAPNRASMIAWIHQGRVRLDDEVRPHRAVEQPWRRFEEDPELKALFPYGECHMVKRGERVFKAHELSLICEWARAGKVASSDQIYLPLERAWRPASSIPALREAITQHQAPVRAPQRGQAGELSTSQVQRLTAPLYDLARLYLVYHALPPGAALPQASTLVSLGLELSGEMGRQSFESALRALHSYHQGPLSLSLKLGTLEQREALTALSVSVARLIRELMAHLDAFGASSPSRVVVGSDPDALRHPDERAALEALERALRDVIPKALSLKRLSAIQATSP